MKKVVENLCCFDIDELLIRMSQRRVLFLCVKTNLVDCGLYFLGA